MFTPKKIFRAIFKRRLSKTTSLLAISLLSIVALSTVLSILTIWIGSLLSRPPNLPKVSYSEFITIALDKDFLEKDITLKYKAFLTRDTMVIFTWKETHQKQWTYFETSPSIGQTPEEWLRRLDYNVRQEKPFPWGYVSYGTIQAFTMGITSLLMMGMFIWFLAGGGITKAFEEMSAVRGSKKLVGQRITLDDVAGIEPEKNRIRGFIKIMKSTENLKAVGAQPPRGIFLHGPPGTGKTLLARAIIFESGLPHFWMSGSDFGAPLVGIATQKADTLFEEAFRSAPSIIVIDEMDSAAPRRASLGPFETKERTSLVNKLLSLQDRIEKEGIPVYVIGITNFPEAIDPAILREGRFDEKIEIPLPMTIKDRKAILEVHTTRPNKKPLAKDVDLNAVATQTLGFSGASLAALVNKAALRAVSQNRKVITMEDFEESIELVIMGPIREIAPTETEREMIARHEAAHALAYLLLPEIDPPQIVSLLPRGKALGFVWSPAKREYFLQTKERLLSLIKSILAGYAAEKIFYGQVSTGPHSDLEKATYLAYDMVFEYGMSNLGPFRLGRQNNFNKMWSDETISLAENEVMRIIKECEEEMTKLFSRPENKQKLMQLSAKLLETKRLDYAEIMKAIE